MTAARRRDRPVDQLRITPHQIQILKRMQQGAHIFFDDDTCVLLVVPQRKISHRCVKSLRQMRLIRNRDKTEPEVYVITNRGLAVLEAQQERRHERSMGHDSQGDR